RAREVDRTAAALEGAQVRPREFASQIDRAVGHCDGALVGPGLAGTVTAQGQRRPGGSDRRAGGIGPRPAEGQRAAALRLEEPLVRPALAVEAEGAPGHVGADRALVDE